MNDNYPGLLFSSDGYFAEKYKTKVVKEENVLILLRKIKRTAIIRHEKFCLLFVNIHVLTNKWRGFTLRRTIVS
jgi:hypothetical protein